MDVGNAGIGLAQRQATFGTWIEPGIEPDAESDVGAIALTLISGCPGLGWDAQGLDQREHRIEYRISILKLFLRNVAEIYSVLIIQLCLFSCDDCDWLSYD